jgi:hypothetical protein
MVENRFLTILTSLTSCSTHKSVLWANKWYSIILWFHPRRLLNSWPHKITLWAIIATHLWAKCPKIVENRFCWFTIWKPITSLNQNMHANLGYQPQVSTKFQLNRTAHSRKIAIFVRPNNNKQTSNKQQTWISEGRWNHSPLRTKILTRNLSSP